MVVYAIVRVCLSRWCWSEGAFYFGRGAAVTVACKAHRRLYNASHTPPCLVTKRLSMSVFEEGGDPDPSLYLLTP